MLRVTCGPDPGSPGVLHAVLGGELEVHGATQLWEAISPRLTAQTPSLLVDMGGVEWISSAGVGTLIRLLSRAESLGGKLAVFGCASKVSQVFRITALEAVLGVCDSADAARMKLR